MSTQKITEQKKITMHNSCSIKTNCLFTLIIIYELSRNICGKFTLVSVLISNGYVDIDIKILSFCIVFLSDNIQHQTFKFYSISL